MFLAILQILASKLVKNGLDMVITSIYAIKKRIYTQINRFYILTQCLISNLLEILKKKRHKNYKENFKMIFGINLHYKQKCSNFPNLISSIIGIQLRKWVQKLLIYIYEQENYWYFISILYQSISNYIKTNIQQVQVRHNITMVLFFIAIHSTKLIFLVVLVPDPS